MHVCICESLWVPVCVLWDVSLKTLEVGHERTPSHRMIPSSRSLSAEIQFCRGGGATNLGGTGALNWGSGREQKGVKEAEVGLTGGGALHGGPYAMDLGP